MHLPDPFLNYTNADRFDFEETGHVARLISDYVVNRFQRIESKINEWILRWTRLCGVRLEGPQGIGKSCALFLIAVALMSKKGYRVTYVQDCREWRKSQDEEPFKFLLNELLMTFAHDTIEGRSMKDWAD